MAPPRKPETEAPPDGNDLDEAEIVEASDPASDDVEEQEDLTIIQALSRVMGDVQSVSKTGHNTSQNYNFRGIDAVVNAVGPALRARGVVVVPIHVINDSETYQTKSGTAMKNVGLTVMFRFYGPKGDYIEATARGEAADSGDKATAKAHSVAFRTLLLQALCIPTDEPDPDEFSHERVHESGFQRGSADDARPTERRIEQPAYNFPKDWPELAGRMGALIGAEEAAVWMRQAAAIATGDHVKPVGEMDEEAKRIVWDVLTKTLRTLDQIEGDLQLHPSPRETISAAFAEQLEGQILSGPPWALTGTEAENGYPQKETVAGEDAAAGHDAEVEEAEVHPDQQVLDAEAAEAALADK